MRIESNSPLPFENGLDGESVIGKLINRIDIMCQDDYRLRLRRYVDAEEFMMVLLNKLFDDRESPFNPIFVEFTQCSSCDHVYHPQTIA